MPASTPTVRFPFNVVCCSKFAIWLVCRVSFLRHIFVIFLSFEHVMLQADEVSYSGARHVEALYSYRYAERGINAGH